MSPSITTERLILRAPEPGDSQALFPAFSDSDAMRFFGPERVLSEAETAQWIDNHENLRAAEGFAPWVACEKGSNRPVGWGGLSRDSRDASPCNELLYIIAPDRWGRGFGCELAAASIRNGFDALELDEIAASVWPENIHSVRILERLGMHRFREDEDGRRWYRMFREGRGQRPADGIGSPVRAVIIGNAGSGKTTLARRLAGGREVPDLSLDDIAWEHADPPARRAAALACADIDRFIASRDEWIVEGCYGTLIAHAAARAGQLYFLNLPPEACVANCRSRPWEPDKYASREAQDEKLEMLVDWVRDYETRDDDCSLRAHRQIFEAFKGDKVEFRSNEQAAS